MLLNGMTASAQILRKRTELLMGCRFEITIVDRNASMAEQAIDSVVAEITRIENIISEWIPTSQVSEINRNAGLQPVKVDQELFDLIQRALKLSQITHGAFDISFAAMDKIWKFDGSMTEMPTPEAINKSVAKVGYQKIVIDTLQTTVFLKEEGMKIGFGSIGKGYAADKSRAKMISRGITAGIVNASGDLAAWGKQPDGRDWQIGIINPIKTNKLLAILSLQEEAVTTSGSYENYVKLNGKRYGHIINPATGYPSTGICSVTIRGPDAETANGFSTALMVLGKEEGLKLMRQYPAYQMIMITDQGKVIKTSKSSK
jgi:thiamine biosynthesis lipoprotein